MFDAVRRMEFNGQTHVFNQSIVTHYETSKDKIGYQVPQRQGVSIVYRHISKVLTRERVTKRAAASARTAERARAKKAAGLGGKQ